MKSSVAASRPAGNAIPRPSLRVDPPCIDLSERFGQRFRVVYEESYFAQYGPRARVNDPWLKIVPCRAGHICPWGGGVRWPVTTLAAATNRPGPIARKLAALPGTVLWNDGDDGATVLFDLAIFDEVAKLMHPKRRRKPPTQAQLAALAQGRRPFGRIPVDKHAPKGRHCVRTVLCDLEAVQVEAAASEIVAVRAGP
jgi:hypothetical protein